MDKNEAISTLKDELNLEYWDISEFAEDLVEISPKEEGERHDQVILTYGKIESIGQTGAETTMIDTESGVVMLRDDGTIKITL